MRLYIALLALVASLVIAGPAFARCEAYAIDDITNDDVWWDARNPFSVTVESDVDGTDTTLSISMMSCVTANDTDTCDALNVVDSDNDGIPDTNVLTGTPPKRGVQRIEHAGHVFFDVTVAPGGGDAKLLICTISY